MYPLFVHVIDEPHPGCDCLKEVARLQTPLSTSFVSVAGLFAGLSACFGGMLTSGLSLDIVRSFKHEVHCVQRGLLWFVD